MKYSQTTLTVVLALIGVMLLGACAGGATQRSTGTVIDDSSIAVRVKTALIGNEQTKARQIDVQVYQGEVQLNGFVDSAAARSAADDTARTVQGVKSVRNNLQIRAADHSAGQVVDDALITGKVKTALVGDPRTKAHQIEVETNEGVVQLAGFVDSPASKSAANEVAKAVEGVSRVVNNIEVK